MTWRATSPSPITITNHKAKGFTLVELAIVIVIIGLLVGGVLQGQELIRTSQINSAVSEMQNINSAVQSFKGKYNCLPGDCSNISTLISGAVNGNGNGLVGDDNGLSSPYYQMAKANFIKGDFLPNSNCSASNTNSSGNIMPLSKLTASHYMLWVPYWTYYAVPANSKTSIRIGNYQSGASCNGTTLTLPEEAYKIDQKVDDGVASTGRLYTGTNGTCLDGSQNYNLTVTSITAARCYIDFWLDL